MQSPFGQRRNENFSGVLGRSIKGLYFLLLESTLLVLLFVQQGPIITRDSEYDRNLNRWSKHGNVCLKKLP